MARRRMIDPNIWQSEDVSRLSVFARLLLIGMISTADDEGRGRAMPAYLASTIFPYDTVRTADMENAISEICRNVSVVVYKVNRSRYYAFTNWKKWQRVDKPQASIFPSPEEGENDSGMIPELLRNDSGLKEKKRKEEKGKEEKGRERARMGEFQNVLLTDEEYGKLASRFGNAASDRAIEELSGYMRSKGREYKDHYATLLGWIKRNEERSQPANGKKSFRELVAERMGEG